jgi:hypothetical protein
MNVSVLLLKLMRIGAGSCNLAMYANVLYYACAVTAAAAARGDKLDLQEPFALSVGH